MAGRRKILPQVVLQKPLRLFETWSHCRCDPFGGRQLWLENTAGGFLSLENRSCQKDPASEAMAGTVHARVSGQKANQ